MTKEYADYLAHYGVKGQKHGKRRWQNEDGSLTEEGRIHYGVGDPREKNTGGGSSGDNKKAISDINGVLNSNNLKVRKAFTDKDRADLTAFRDKLGSKEYQERQAKVRRILGITAGVAVAGLVAYGVYRGTGKLKQEFISKAREGAKRNFRDAANFNTTARDYQNQAIESMRTDGLRADYYNKVGTMNAWRRTADASMSRGMAQRKAAKSATRASAFINWIRNRGKIIIR